MADELYNATGIYSYSKGFNYIALIALLAGILPNVPGFLVTVHLVDADLIPVFISSLYHYAWFVGFGVSFILYLILMKRRTNG